MMREAERITGAMLGLREPKKANHHEGDMGALATLLRKLFTTFKEG